MSPPLVKWSHTWVDDTVHIQLMYAFTFAERNGEWTLTLTHKPPGCPGKWCILLKQQCSFHITRRVFSIISRNQTAEVNCGAKTPQWQYNLKCSVLMDLCPFHLFQVSITSGDSGSLPCPDMLSVLLRPPSFFFFFIHLFVFNHSHSVDQKPWDNRMSRQWDFLFNTLQSWPGVKEVGLWVLEPHSSFPLFFFSFFLCKIVI